MTSFNCEFCKLLVQPDDQITCDLCRTALHVPCAGLSRADAQYAKTKNRKLSFFCSQCSDFKSQLFKIQELTSLVNSLQSEVRELKDKLSSKVPSSQERGMDFLGAEKVINEVSDRERRRNNLMFFNVPELPNVSRSDQASADINSVGEVFSAMNVVADFINPVRLGKYDPTNNQLKRPLRITLSRSDLIPDILRKSGKLKSCDKFKTFFIAKDRTPMQTAYFKSIKAQLDTRIASGESDIGIRFFQDVPRIVDLKTHRGN